MPFRRTSIDSNQRTGFYSPKRSRVVGSRLVFPTDPDAAAYIAAVESADGQELEFPIKVAYNDFVLGCKSDGIWNAIKASCITAGARTLNGALVPLVGTAPTNINFSGAEDSSWNSVSLLLRGEGADNSTTFTDSSPNPLTPTVSASNVLDILASAGKFGSGIKYTNTGTISANIRYNNPTALQFGTGDFTWECWIRPDAAPAAGFYNVLWDSRASGDALTNRLYVDFYPNGGSTVRCYANGTLIQSTTNLSIGVWYHVAVCKASGTTRLFLNGVEEASTSDSANYTNGTNRPILFNNVLVNQQGKNFSLDELRVTKGVARYTSNFTPPSTAFPGSLQSDYNRTTGLLGDGSTKSLNSNRAANADPQNSRHMAVYLTSAGGVTEIHMGDAVYSASGNSVIYRGGVSGDNFGGRSVHTANLPASDLSITANTVSSSVPCFFGIVRTGANAQSLRGGGQVVSNTISSVAPTTETVRVFTNAASEVPTTARLSFYSIGESLNLALLDTRVSGLMVAISGAIS